MERNTKDLVAKVRAKYEKYPAILAPVLESIHCVSQQFLRTLETAGGGLDLTQMEDLIDLNQGLLETLGVSHSSLQRIINIFAQYGQSSNLSLSLSLSSTMYLRSAWQANRSRRGRVRLRPGASHSG